MTQPNLPRGARTLAELASRAGNPAPKYAPLLSSVVASSRPGWLTVTVSPSPGEHLTYQVPVSRYDERTIASILQASPAIYGPAGLTTDLFQPEG